MIIELMLIFCFQAMYGYVFSWIGMLLVSFMGGLGSGSILVAQARRR
jgi:spermidine synthase